MPFLNSTTLLLATTFLTVLGAPPNRPRDEWQPADPNQNPPPGASIPTISSTLTTSSPTSTTSFDETETTSPVANNQTCIYLTNAADWAGEGINLCNPSAECSPKLPDGLTAQVLSAGPSPNEICFLFPEEQCQGPPSPLLMYPGVSDLETIGFGNKAKSWMCWHVDGLSGTGSESNSQPPTGSSVESVPTTPPASEVGNGVAEQMPTPGGLPVRSSTASPNPTNTDMATPVSSMPGGLPVSAFASLTFPTTTTITTATDKDEFSVQPTDVTLDSVPETSLPTDATLTGTTPTDTMASVTDVTSVNDHTADPTTDPPMTVTHMFADGSTVVTTL